MCSADVLNKNNIPRDEEHPRMEQEDALHNLSPYSVQSYPLKWLEHKLSKGGKTHLNP